MFLRFFNRYQDVMLMRLTDKPKKGTEAAGPGFRQMKGLVGKMSDRELFGMLARILKASERNVITLPIVKVQGTVPLKDALEKAVSKAGLEGIDLRAELERLDCSPLIVLQDDIKGLDSLLSRNQKRISEAVGGEDASGLIVALCHGLPELKLTMVELGRMERMASVK
jgi:hypothetical protein